MDFKPPPNVRALKFQDDMQAGIFLGYDLAPGGVWKGRYMAAFLKDFEESSTSQITVHRVKEVNFYSQILKFPLWDAREKERTTIYHLRSISKIKDPDESEVPKDSPIGDASAEPADPITLDELIGDEAPYDNQVVDDPDDAEPPLEDLAPPPLTYLNYKGEEKVKSYKGSWKPPDMESADWAALNNRPDLKREHVKAHRILKGLPPLSDEELGKLFVPKVGSKPRKNARPTDTVPDGTSSALPAKHRPKSTLIEFCSHSKSPFENSCPEGQQHIRMTAQDILNDAAAPMRAVTQPNPILWARIPRAAGVSIGNMIPSKQRCMHQRNACLLWQRFRMAAEKCVKLGGTCVIEWPENCRYWNTKSVQRVLRTQLFFDEDYLRKVRTCYLSGKQRQKR